MNQPDGRAGDPAEQPAHTTGAREKPTPGSRALAMTSLASAIAALTVFWAVVLAAGSGADAVDGVVVIVAGATGVVLGLGAVLTGLVARRRVRRGRAAGGGLALAGLVLGIVAVVVPAIALVGLVYMTYAEYQEFEHCVRGSGYPKYLCLKECPSFLDSLCRREVGW